MELWRLAASDAIAKIKAGEITSESLVRSCLDRINACEADIRAWSYLDADAAIYQAREFDKASNPGPLCGVPVAIKDIIDTRDMPTQHNSPIYVGHCPGTDASCVTQLKAAGAVIMGKVDTVEFASLGRKARTANPHNIEHTPGGSSAGTGAAVGAQMVPLGIGTQTGGSTIRPASFCGTYGMKPTYCTTSFGGAKPYSQSLDTIGWLGNSAMDLALVAQALAVIDQPGTAGEISTMKIGYYEGPHWDETLPETRDALNKAAELLANAGAIVEKVSSPPEFAELTHAQDIIMHGEGRTAFVAEYMAHRHSLHEKFCDEVENKMGITSQQFRWVYDHIGACRPKFDLAFEGYDAWLTASVPGEAPKGLENGGVATFNRMWTALHVPCINIPSFKGPNNLPVGVQLIARRFDDKHLLAVCDEVAKVIVETQ
jgi:Asp-tRNA(Asn)/Glu-tRNA(Gln) amidotransferase A subunit family amidase